MQILNAVQLSGNNEEIYAHGPGEQPVTIVEGKKEVAKIDL